MCGIVFQVTLRCVLSFLFFCGARIPRVNKGKAQHDSAHFIKRTCLILCCTNPSGYRKSRNDVVRDDST